MDRPIGKSVRLPVGVLGSTRLIGTPDTIIPISSNLSAVSSGSVVAWSCRGDRVDKRLRDFRREDLEVGIRWPTRRSRCAATVISWLRIYRSQAESDGQKRREEEHGCA